MKSIRKSLQEYVRGVVGGLLFSIPILFTMEVWWMGFIFNPSTQLAYLLLTFLLLLGYNRYAGLRKSASWQEVVIDSVEELGIGLVLSAIFLWLIGVLDFDNMALERISGMIVVEAMTVAIGVSVGTAQLVDVGEDENQGLTALDEADTLTEKASIKERAVIAICASVLFAANIAPTDEILLIAIMLSPARALLLVLMTLLLCGLILFYTEFKGAKILRDWHKPGALEVLTDTLMSYSLALLSATVILWLFDKFASGTLLINVFQVIVLSVAGALGATAGRLLLK